MFVARSLSVAARLLEEEMVIMCPLSSKLFVLNPVGTAIWNALDGGKELGEVVRSRICTEFEVEYETAMADAKEFLQQLAEHGVVVIGDEPLVSEAGPDTELRKAV
jgi:ribulose-5-phosphate 4-epimerase/fuculose-1-phosphate aldolase